MRPLDGRSNPVPELGNRRSIVHVADVADALLHVRSRAATPGRVVRYFIAHGRPYSTREMIDTMRIACQLCRAR